MGLIEALKKNWRINMDQYGLWGYTSDNAILFTVECYIILKKLKALDYDDLNRLHYALSKLARYENGKRVTGLYNRYPEKNDRKDQHDNYTAIAATCMFGEDFKKYAAEIDDYGKNHTGFSWDNRAPYKFSVNPFWRPLLRLQFKEALKYFECVRQGFDLYIYKCCAGRMPFGFFGIWYLWFVLKIITTILKKQGNESSQLLTWVTFNAIGNNWYNKPLYWLWKRRVRKLYQDGILDVIRIYHCNQAYGGSEDSDIFKFAHYAVSIGKSLE